jgi:hypothetical protein
MILDSELQAGSGLCITRSDLQTLRSSSTHIMNTSWRSDQASIEYKYEVKDLDRDIGRKSKAIRTKKHQITICFLISTNMVKPIWNVLPTMDLTIGRWGCNQFD